MITGRDFVVLSDAWDGLPTSTMHLFRRIMRGNRVFWFNTINRMPQVTWRDARRLLQTAGRWANFSRAGQRISNKQDCSQNDGPHVVNPLMIPWFTPVVRNLNCSMLLRTYRRIAREHHISDPIIVATFPSVADFVRSVECSLRLYYCVDDWIELPGYHREQFHAMEQQMFGDVDGVIVTSRALEKKCRPGCPRLYLPHGVDFLHFHGNGHDLDPIPQVAAIPRPIVGFFGIIGEWVDLELVASLARAFPAVSFVLIGDMGETEVSMELLQNLHNLHFLGRVSYDALPRYAQYFDVGLIPFVRNKLTRAVNPVKLLEYLALGLPVLATRLPEIEQVAGPIWLASNHEEFCTNLKTVLEQGSSPRRNEAIEIARNSTWDDRVQTFSDFTESLLQDQSPNPMHVG